MPVVDSEPPPAPNPTSATNDEKPKRKRKFVGITQAFDEAAARRAAKTDPPPWIAQKIVIIFVLGLWCYTFYVFVGRFCFRLIKSGKKEWKGEGIGFIVGFVLLWCMFGLTYAKIIFTSPGYAKDHVRPQPRPEFTQAEPRPSWDSDESDPELAAGPPYPSSSSPTSPTTLPSSARRDSRRDTARNRDTEKAIVRSPSSPSHSSERSPSSTAVNSEESSIPKSNPIMPMQAVLAPPSTVPAMNVNKKLSPIHPRPNTAERNTQHLARKHNLPASYFQRKPPQHAALLEYRYCSREGFVKPLRAHHCRSCARCVLEYDHHCPWIGQCVGARNRKFFIIFNFWSTWFTLYTFITLLVINATRGGDPDAQEIVIICLCGIFTLFTSSMCMTQTYLILWNMTTVEHLSVKSIRERDRAVLSTMHGCLAVKAKRKTKREWDQEWGRVGKEGNIWWLGSAGKNWKSVMGDNWQDWFLPIGRSRRNGLDYEVNPRFDKEGRWRPRSEWPEELR